MNETTAKLDAVGHCLETEDACARGEEMASIVKGVEADEIAAENTEQYFATDGKDP